MLRITPNSSAEGAKAYYTAGLNRADYYIQGQEVVGLWHGKAAAQLGLEGQVTREDFFALIENRNPVTGERLTARTNDNRRVGYDFTFNAPKSVSVLYGLTKDDNLLSAFRKSVRDTMEELEADARTRVRRKGEDGDRVAGNLVWGEFVHFTARPVDGLPDPHLHIHCFALNATHDPIERRWKAVQFGAIKRDATYYEAAFHARIAKAVANQGYGVRHTKTGWEISGVPDRTLEAFSRRTHLIEAKAESLGIRDAKEKAGLGAKTRDRKAPELTHSQLWLAWNSRLSDSDRRAIDLLTSGQRELGSPTRTAREGVEHALLHSFEHQSVVSDKRLLSEALWHSMGSVEVDEVKAEFARSDVVRRSVDGQTLVTTQRVLAEERRMVSFARDGRGTCTRLAPSEQIKTERLNTGQRDAVLDVWQSHDRVMIVRGGAGTGKTTMMKEAVRGLNASGYDVLALAPTAEAARNVLRSEGFATAETVANFLLNPALQETVRNQVVWIDEAGLMGTRTMGQVFDLAEKMNCRVILSGDVRQHGSVERGDALRLLETEAGLIAAEIREIQRQKGDYKQAVAALAKGDLDRGFALLDAMGAIREERAETAHRNIATDYVSAVERGQSVLVVSPTHFENQDVTKQIRNELKARGRLGDEMEFESFASERFTEAEKKDARNYRSGQIVIFHSNAKSYRHGESISVHRIGAKPLATVEIPERGIKKGARLAVVEADDRTVTVKDSKGNHRTLPLGEAKKFDVFRAEQISVATGELVRITRNSKTLDGEHELRNGATFHVDGFTREGNIRLRNGWTVGRSHGHFTHGYASTSHSSQGKTVDRVLIAERSASLAAASAEQFYVSVSRGRREVAIYTDDKQALRRAVAERSMRLSGIELMREHKLRPDSLDRWQRLRAHGAGLMQRAVEARVWMAQKIEALIPKSGRMR